MRLIVASQFTVIFEALGMRTAIVLFTVAGFVFGLWPHVLDNSGMQGFRSATAFCIMQAVVFLVVSLFAFGNLANFWITIWLTAISLLLVVYCKWLGDVNTQWKYVLMASALSATGLLCVTVGMNLSPTNLKSVFLCLMSVIQVMTFMSVHVYKHRQDLGSAKIGGFIICIIGIVLLFKKGPEHINQTTDKATAGIILGK
jgi:hypothetical protein